MATQLVIDRIFLFYEGMDPALYTPLTGINLNKTPRILAKAIDDLQAQVDGLGSGGGGPDTRNPLSDALDLDDSNTSGSSRAIYLLKQMIDNIQVSGGGVPLSDDPGEDDPTKAASTSATKKLLDMINSMQDTKNPLSDALDLDDSNTSGSSRAIYLLNQKIDNLPTGGTQLSDTTDTPKGEIPQDPKMPISFIGEDQTLYLGKPREWVKITTSQGEGLIPVFETGAIVDRRN